MKLMQYHPLFLPSERLAFLFIFLFIKWAFVRSSFVSTLIGNNKNSIFRYGLSTVVHRSRCFLPSTRRNEISSRTAMIALADEGYKVNPKASLEIVLLGVGDMRVDDHGGFFNALERLNLESNSKILPAVALTDDVIRNIPSAISHTYDTSEILVAAIEDINESLKTLLHPDLILHTIIGSTLCQSVDDMIASIQERSCYDNINIHVCDLGDADNEIGYGPYSRIFTSRKAGFENHFTIVPWRQELRTDPWNDVSMLTQSYPLYVKKYTKSSPSSRPLDFSNIKINSNQIESIDGYQILPSSNQISLKITNLIQGDIGSSSGFSGDVVARCQAEICTGMYMSHWGGLRAETIKGSVVQNTLKSYVNDCRENDAQWIQHSDFIRSDSNERSLEHASMQWQLQCDGKFEHERMNIGNWMEGEIMIRFLAAPLLFGTISARRIWHLSNYNKDNFFRLKSIAPQLSPVREMVESREWHRLLAARNIRCDPAYRGQGVTTYKYWRYQGFLCRYAVTKIGKKVENKAETIREGILLIHGFGASGAQWNKSMHALFEIYQKDKFSETPVYEGLAPDLVGFGQSEKPSISYTGYLWDSQMLDFCKEIGIDKYKWTSYVTGGNSIGGFTSLSLAASDCAQLTIGSNMISSSGAPGTQRCTGLVLMNSAGPIRTKAEIENESIDTIRNAIRRVSVAQKTVHGGLPPCKPPARPITRALSNALLWYLRPRIREICKSLYPVSPAAVDENLCRSILRDSNDPGAIYVLMSGAKLPTPRTANELLAAEFGAPLTEGQVTSESCFKGPVLIAQGILDPLNDAVDRMNRFGALRAGVTTVPIEAGHCPQDETPFAVANCIATWMLSRPKSSLEVMSRHSLNPVADANRKLQQ